MKPLAVLAGAALLIANLILAGVVGHAVRGRAKAEAALQAEELSHAATRDNVARLERQVDTEKEIQKHLALKAVEDLAEKDKEYDKLLQYTRLLSTPFAEGEAYEDGYRIAGCSVYQLKVYGNGIERYIPTGSLGAFWKTRAGVTVIEAVRHQ